MNLVQFELCFKCYNSTYAVYPVVTQLNIIMKCFRLALTFKQNDLDPLRDSMTVKKKILRLEKIVHERLRFTDLYDKLTDAASQLMHKHPDLLNYIESKTQADYVICYESVNGCCDGAISNDGDFIMVGGEKCL